jgi:hypothetical protein
VTALERPTLTIPVPVVRPLDSLLDRPEYVQEVWDAFVKPDQDSGLPPSIEMRLLMAILRAVYQGLSALPATEATP